MRILHLGAGFRPMRRGGLVAYVEDLMAEQVGRGHQVGYFFSGRFYPWLTGPRLRRWRRGGVAMFEVVNSPLHDHGRQPELELSEPRVERMLERILDELEPHVVHAQELVGLPTSVLEVTRAAGIPTVVTLQDYYPLCPTFKLLDFEGRVCLRREIGADCVATTASSPSDPGLLFEATLKHDLVRLPIVRSLPSGPRDRRIHDVSRALAQRYVRPARPPAGDPAAAFQARRDKNVERLSGADATIAMSGRVAEIYEQLGVDPSRLRTMQLTLAHIERLRPRSPTGEGPITFGTLGGLESAPKGARVLLDAVRRLEPAVRGGRLRLVAFGQVDPPLLEEAERLAGVDLRGPFRPAHLDRLLDEVDVGIVPSVWEEAYGYAGMEFLAKGIPVIANEIGGMTDYVREGQTGWLNRSCSPAELARIMQDVADHPERVTALNSRIRAERDRIVKPMGRHADEMDTIYGELTAAAPAPHPTT